MALFPPTNHVRAHWPQVEPHSETHAAAGGLVRSTAVITYKEAATR